MLIRNRTIEIENRVGINIVVNSERVLRVEETNHILMLCLVSRYPTRNRLYGLYGLYYI